MSAHDRHRYSRPLSEVYRTEILPRLAPADVFPGVRFRGFGRHLRAPCPLHGGRNLSFTIDPERLTWRCFSDCQDGGDAPGFLMKRDSIDFVSAVRELGRIVGVDVEAGNSSREPKTTSRPARPKRELSTGPKQPPYPPADQVAALWSACRPVHAALDTAAWLQSKSLDPIAIADADLARALPHHTALAELPDWAHCKGRSWRKWGYHLISPMFDVRGGLVSLEARYILRELPIVRGEKLSKAYPPFGYRKSGLIFACPLARQILRSGALPEWWSDCDSGAPPPLRLTVVEGAKKLMMRALSASEADEFAPATVGITSGSWTVELAARIPDGTEVQIFVDPNKAGCRYAEIIVQSLMPRIAECAIRLELRPEFTLTMERGQPVVTLKEAA